MQKEGIKQLIKKKNHHLITPEIVKALENETKEDIIRNNLNRSFTQSSIVMGDESRSNNFKVVENMNLE